MNIFSSYLSNPYASAKAFTRAHRTISIGIAMFVIIVGWWGYKHVTAATAPTRYVLGTVQKNTIVASVSASGQISASNQLDIKPKVSGEVIAVTVSPGQKVAAGTLIAEIDPSDAQKAVRDAEVNLQSAKLNLAKIEEPADTLTSTQAANAVSSAYNSSRSDIVGTYLDLQSIMASLADINSDVGSNDFLPGNIGVSAGEPSRNAVLSSYDAASKSYQSAFADYSTVTISTADQATVDRLLTESISATESVSNAVKSESAFLEWYENAIQASGQKPVSSADTDLTTLTSSADKLASHLSSLTIDQSAVGEKELSLQKVQTGADTIDVQSSQLSVTKAENALQDAQSTLADYYIRAPFAGMIAAVPVHKYDTAGSAAAVATLITSQKIAELSLNEVDVAKIKLGDKATLTFDAIDGLSLTGKVAEISPLGTVTQGVVSYSVKIGFDSQDTRIQPGMTVNAAIITDVHQDVLTVPSSAIKSQGGSTYVLAFDPALADTGSTQGVLASTPPQQIPVEAGISDDTNTEILSGLQDNEQIVVRTISGTQTTTAQTSAPSLFGGGGRGAGGAAGGSRAGGGATLIR